MWPAGRQQVGTGHGIVICIMGDWRTSRTHPRQFFRHPEGQDHRQFVSGRLERGQLLQTLLSRIGVIVIFLDVF